MHKKISKRTAGWISGGLSQLFAMIMAGILIVVSSRYLVYHEFQGAYFNDPFEKSDTFTESGTFQNVFFRDMNCLATYMACCAQLETENAFDETKVIDIFQYWERKLSSTEKTKNYPELTYRIGDLMEWYSYGINYYYEDVTLENSEEYRTEYDEEYRAEYGDESLPEVEEDFAEGSENEADNLPDRTFTIEELYKPVNVESVFDLELPEGMSYEEVATAVLAAASDLTDNYYTYLQYQSLFDYDKNIKYMFVTPTGDIAYTNLTNQKNLSTDQLKSAFRSSKVHLIYNYPRKGQSPQKFESSGLDDNIIISYKTLFMDRAYSFPEGGTLYVALQEETNDAFGALNENDFYAYAAKAYLPNGSQSPQMTTVMLVSGVLAFITLILFILFQPKKKKEELRHFDRWFTEIAAGFAIGSAIFVGAAGVTMAKIVFMDLDGLTYVQRSDGYRICLFVYFSLLYLMLLFYMGSLVRRIKAGVFWKGSFCYYVLHNIKNIIRKMKELTGKCLGIILNNKSLLIRTFGPYGLFLFLNLCFPMLFGGFGLVLNVIFDIVVAGYLYLNNKAREEIVNGISRICDGEVEYQIKTEGLYGENKVIAEAVNQIGNAVKNAVQISMKDERLKADLITNVSHDIKTPLTSIINYVDLLKRENIQGEKAQEYIRILDEKSQRLKQLTLDLVEASKISSGNITLEMEDLDVTELMKQALGEYEDRLEEKKLNVLFQYPQDGEKVLIHADSRRMWRILENLFVNICKYAMEGTRVYVDIERLEENVEIIIRNISAQPLNIPADELTQRFIRGDISRSTEGSGLGLSIAQNLTTAQGGRFEIYLDGDLFKVSISFPLQSPEA